MLQVAKRDRAMLELGADDALGRQAQSVAIEAHDLSRSSTPMVTTVMRGFMADTSDGNLRAIATL